MSSPQFQNDVVFDQIYRKRIQKMTDAHINAVGSKIFLDGVNFAANHILHMVQLGVEITPENVSSFIEGALASKAMSEQEAKVNEQPIKHEEVINDKPKPKFERIQ